VALLSIFGRRASGQRVALLIGYSGLALAFAFLALGRAQAFGIHHGNLAIFTRLAFGVYGVSLVIIIGRYWLAACQARGKPKPGDG